MADSIIADNQLKKKLRQGERVIGTMVCEFRQPSVMQLLANAGFDFVIIDNEHGPFSIETIADLSRMARHLGLTPLVRVPDLTYSHLTQPLDGGAQGIMLPRVRTPEHVQQALQIMKYPPLGQRGNALSRGYTDFKSGSPAEAMARANEENMLVVQIETQKSIDNIEQIVTIPGVDVTLIGPNDLSIALGVPGQLDSPVLHAAMEKMIDACRRHDVVPGLHINSIEWATYWAERGMQLLSSFSETGLLVRAGQRVTEAIKSAEIED